MLKDNKVVRPVAPSAWGNEERWKRLLRENDQRKIWKSINWDGSIDEMTAIAPSDEEFKLHFENLLNPQSTEYEDVTDVSDSPFIPVLDDPITETEVIEAGETCTRPRVSLE